MTHEEAAELYVRTGGEMIRKTARLKQANTALREVAAALEDTDEYKEALAASQAARAEYEAVVDDLRQSSDFQSAFTEYIEAKEDAADGWQTFVTECRDVLDPQEFTDEEERELYMRACAEAGVEPTGDFDPDAAMEQVALERAMANIRDAAPMN